jgi:hypothetical protein
MNSATIYTDIHTVLCGDLFVNKYLKKCVGCSVIKFASEFYPRNPRCKECYNLIRREGRNKSVCLKCHVEFRPGVSGRYKFCSDMCRFMDKTSKDVSGCWLWKAHVQKKRGGYGTFVAWGKKSILAHRFSFKLFYGYLDDDKLVLHSCHNPICVNPSHLRQGTPMENTIDRKAAGRTTNQGKVK